MPLAEGYEEVKAIYEEYYKGEEAAIRRQLEEWFQDPAGYFQVALRWLRETSPLAGSRVLEIGCGAGRLLAELRAEGARTLGIEVNSQAALYAKKWYGVEILVGRVEELEGQLQDGSFDIVALFELIEHLVDPLDVLRRLRRLLSDRGLLLLSTPNFSLFWSQRKGYSDLSTHFEHIQFFQPKTLTALVQRAGFDVKALLPCGSQIPLTEQVLARTGLRPSLTAWWPRLRQVALVRVPLRLAYRGLNRLTKRLGVDRHSYNGLFSAATKIQQESE